VPPSVCPPPPLWDNMEKYCRVGRATDDNITWRMRIAWRIPEDTNKHSEYVILIAFPLQQRLHERASMLRYTYSVCLVCFTVRRYHIFLHEQ